MAISENTANETFLGFWQQNPNSPEGKLAEAYNKALQDFDSLADMPPKMYSASKSKWQVDPSVLR